MPLASCPTREELAAFSAGELDDVAVATLGTHVDSCLDCQRLLETSVIEASDTIVSALRRPAEANPHGAESACQSAVERIAALPDNSAISLPIGTPIAHETPLQQLRKYKLLAKLGEGGMGAVYKALHTRLDKTVAIKVLPADRMRDAGAVARFQREMKAVGRVDHPNIVRAMDAGEENGMHYLVMEYVPGSDLSQLAKSVGPLPVADACELVRQAALGLAEANEHGMVHRDIKPSNLILTQPRKKKDQPVVKILDLGLALLSEAFTPDQRGLTSTGQMMGTIDYMAPEQGGDSHLVDIRADIYSLGATLYRLLAGEAPFAGAKYDTPVKKLIALATVEPQPIRQRRPDIPAPLAAIIHRMLAKDPAARFSTPDEVVEVLAPFCQSANLAALLEGRVQGTGFTVQGMGVGSPGSGVGTADSALSVTSPVNSAVSPSLRPTVSISSSRQIPPRIWQIALAAAGGLALLLAGIVLFIPGKDGTLRVEINDSSIEVAVKGTEIVFKKADKGKDVKVSPGEKTLVVKRGDFSFETDKLVLKKGETVRLSVQLLQGKIEVASADGVLLRSANLPAGPTTPAATTPTWTPSSPLFDGYALQFDGDDYVEIPTFHYDGSHPFTFEAKLTDYFRQNASGTAIFSSICSDNGTHFGLSVILSNSKLDLTKHANAIHASCQIGNSKTVFKAAGRPRTEELIDLATVYDEGKWRIFVNGKHVTESNFPGPVGSQNLLGSYARIGDYVTQKPNELRGYVGFMRHVRVSRSARYTAGYIPPAHLTSDADTYLLYQMDEGQGNVLTDSSPNKHHGKIVGAKWVRADVAAAGSSPQYVTGPHGIEFALVPKGTAWLGGTGGKPGTKKVEFADDWYLGVYEVTQDQWQQVMGSNPSYFSAGGEGAQRVKGIPATKLAQFPVENVTWTDCLEFVRRINIQAKDTGWVYRLPTASEWEYACRGGPMARPEDGALDFYFAEPTLLPTANQANFGGKKGQNRTCEVGAYPPNKLGLYDLHGNVSEWCQDDIGDKETGPLRPLQGGSWDHNAEDFRVGEGYFMLPPANRSTFDGLRLARVRAGTPPGVSPPNVVLAGTSDYALHFAGAAGENVDTSAVLLPTRGPWTVEGWVTPRKPLPAGASASLVFMVDPVWLSVRSHPEGLKWAAGGPTSRPGSTRYSSENAVLDKPAHVAFVRQPEGVLLYVNGEVQGEPLPIVFFAQESRLRICPPGSPEWRDTAFVGDVDEVRVSSIARYDRKFSPQRELTADADTVALFRCDEGTGDVLKDSTVHGRHGKIVGAKWVRVDPAPQVQLPATPPLAIAPFNAARAKELQEAWANHLGTTVDTTNSVGAKMVLIPPGEFLMGSTDEQIAAALKVAEEVSADQGAKFRFQKGEQPPHRVVITKAYLVGATEVTVGQFKQFASAQGYETEAEKAAKDANAQTYLNPGYPVTEDSPAAVIVWNDAAAYCNWLSSQERLEPCYRLDGNTWSLLPGKSGYRLPTEAEWEYACRAGTTTQYWFGDDHRQLELHAWYNKNADGKAFSVGKKKPNPFGLFDLYGNLYEWCEDFYDDKWYEMCPTNDPISPKPFKHLPDTDSNRVLRGGGWNHWACDCRSASRYNHNPSGRYNNHGFRVVREFSMPTGAPAAADQSAAANLDRQVADWVLSVGGQVVIASRASAISKAADLPMGEFVVTGINLSDKAEIADAQLPQFAGLKKLTLVRLFKTKVTAAGVAELQKALPGCKIEWDEPK